MAQFEFVNKGEFDKALLVRMRKLKLNSKTSLQKLAIQVQNEARNLAPVDTGRLRSSINHKVGEDSKGVYADIGSNVEYAPYQEFGTSRMPAQPFLRPGLDRALSRFEKPGWD